MTSSMFKFKGVSDDGLDFTRDDLAKHRVVRGAPGFYRKYFQTRPWTSSVLDIMQKQTTVQHVNKLSAEVLKSNQEKVLDDWIREFQALIAEVTRLSFLCQSAPKSDQTLEARLCIQAKLKDRPGDKIEVLGEYLHDHEGSIESDDDVCLLRFFNRIQQLFAQQPTRRLLHGFTIYGFMLEIWVFDRSGAFSGGLLNLKEAPHLLAEVLMTYAIMDDTALGLGSFLNYCGPQEPSLYVIFDASNKFYLHSTPIAAPDYIVGPGTVCYAASKSKAEQPSAVIKFSWRYTEEYTELNVLKRISKHDITGTIRLVAFQDHLETIGNLHEGLRLPGTFPNSIQSCIAISPLGLPLQEFATMAELLGVLADTAEALQSLYIKGKILHRDLAIKNIIRVPHSDANQSTGRGVLIDLDCAQILDDAPPLEAFKGSDGFVAINVLLGRNHTYNTDLESLFYVFLWLAIGNEREYPHPSIILFNLSENSRLRKWVSGDNYAMAQAKVADMSLQGFENILEEFSSDFLHLRGLAEKLHRLIFCPEKDGNAVIEAETSQKAAERLYQEFSTALRNQSFIEQHRQRNLSS